MTFEYEVIFTEGFYWAVIYSRDKRGVSHFHLRRRVADVETADRVGTEACAVIAERVADGGRP